MILVGMYSQPFTIHHIVLTLTMEDTSAILMSVRLAKAQVLLLLEVEPVTAALSTVDSPKNVLMANASTFHSIQSIYAQMFNAQRNLFVKMENVFNKPDNVLKLVVSDLNAKTVSVFQILLLISALLSAVWRDTLVKMEPALRILPASQMNMKPHQVVGPHVLHQNSAHVEICIHFCTNLHSVHTQLTADTLVILSAVKPVRILKF